ncbi:MAG: sodium:proline symporter [Acidobacteria bacterium]|nr:sodium:proline symporter [Acidobacteriota bacterium]MBF83222.1 sodium:proline symporter [Acidobacteriota bacterium]
MTLTAFDWAVIAGYFALVLAIGIAYYPRASSGIGHYFLSGRSLPWWLAGTSMVATTFAADTPLVVAGLVAHNGIAGNWIWWNAALGSTLAVFFFARLWRRAGIMTDVEFVELRYTGRAAAFLRGFRALYLGLPVNFLIMGWVNLAMAKILLVTMGWDRLTAVLVSLFFTGVYSSISGLWGVVVGDFVQFALAMVGTVALAWFALRLPEVGGIAGLREALPESTFHFLPTIGDADTSGQALALPVAAFIAFVGVQWWASWYPGQEASGGGYVAQRMMSAKDERHSVLATLWFTVAHYCLRPWPWILVGLASIVLYPAVSDREAAYVMVLRDHLPAGWRGLMLASFFAAYMSTIGTQLNWGCSYVINDFYRRFVRTNADEPHYVAASRLTTLVLMALGGLTTFYLESIRQAWEFILESGAGIGLVLILRWYWWRINAWSEVAALVAPAVGIAYLKLFTDVAFPSSLFYLVAWTTFCWLLVTFLTPPEPMTHLIGFYQRIRPGGPGWARIARAAGEPPPETIGKLVIDWAAGWVFVYSALFGIGALLFRTATASLPYGFCALAAGVLLHRRLSRRGWKAVTG